ncbi:efflux RND transporter periplasmic adaptor subunit [Catalinimonas alkaloidigena]|nr:efflux RND transporter periplasmic adaptor subunit [Catalinimonas alkaloidigena]
MFRSSSRWWWGSLLALAACRNGQETSHPAYKTLTEAVYASATLRPVDAYQVYAPVSGILDRKEVQVGDTVRSGEVMFVIRSEASDVRSQQANLQLESARRAATPGSPQLTELELGVENARQRYRADSLQLVRQQNLWDHNATSRQALEQAQLAAQTSQNQYQAAVQRLEAQRRDLQQRVQDAQAHYRLTSTERGDALVTSRLDGRVYRVFVETGELVGPQQAIATVGDRERFLLEMLVDERDISRVQVGQPVLFTTDIYGDSVFRAEVTKIYPALNAESRTFRVDAALPAVADQIYAGASAEANIIIQQKSRALVIPRSLLLAGDSVRVVRDGEEQKVKVQTGIQNLELVEITAGLDTTSQLVMPKEE